MVFVNGQVAKDADGSLVGAGDHAAQARQAFGNLKCALVAVGATGRDVVQYRLSVVDFSPVLLESILVAGRNVFSDNPIEAPSILAGVTALGRPAYLIEIEAIAVLD